MKKAFIFALTFLLLISVASAYSYEDYRYEQHYDGPWSESHYIKTVQEDAWGKTTKITRDYDSPSKTSTYTKESITPYYRGYWELSNPAYRYWKGYQSDSYAKTYSSTTYHSPRTYEYYGNYNHYPSPYSNYHGYSNYPSYYNSYNYYPNYKYTGYHRNYR